MNVLVTVASRHGATWEIGSAVARTLCDRGHHARLVAPEQVDSLDGYDAVVLGSAVYLTRLLPVAGELLDRLGAQLATRPLWLFASGLASPSSGARTSTDLEQLTRRLHARGYRLFRGRLERAGLSFAERVAAAGVLDREGDHRDFGAVERWAGEMAAVLDELPVGSARPRTHV